MRSALAGFLLLLCSGCIGLDGVKSPSASKPAAPETARTSKQAADNAQAKSVSPEEITPANARQTVDALWQELDRAEEP